MASFSSSPGAPMEHQEGDAFSSFSVLPAAKEAQDEDVMRDDMEV